MNTVICAIAKYENDYIAEWVRYHINLGFDHIYIYDNNEIDGERIEDVIPSDLNEKVSVLDVRGKKYMQKIVYNECYRTFDFDWCAFIDIDEFITFNPKSGYTNIEQFLQDRDEFDAIHLNWMCYGDNGMVRKKEGGVVDRFKKPIKPYTFRYTYDFPENMHIKSIIKKNVDIDWNSVQWNSNPHTPWGLGSISDDEGNMIAENSPFKKVGFNIAYIRHYFTKTLEEYSCKIVRQCADCNATFYSFSKFYRGNKITINKLVTQYNILKSKQIYGYDNSIIGCVKNKIKLNNPLFFSFVKKICKL